MKLTAKVALLAPLVLGCSSSSTGTDFRPTSANDTRALFLFSHENTLATYEGHAFVVKREGKPPIAVTAYHVAGSDMTASGAFLHTVSEPSVVVALGARLAIPDARTISAGDSQHDIAAYTVLDFIEERALEFANELPAVGDSVYVLALHVGDHPFSGPRRHLARVTVASDSELRYIYLLSANTNTTSGAAVLDKSGRVVGLNVGTIVNGAGVFGIGVGISSLRSVLSG